MVFLQIMPNPSQMITIGSILLIGFGSGHIKPDNWHLFSRQEVYQSHSAPVITR